MRQRLVQFDILKGIGILLVLLGHTDIVGIPKTFIYGFHMPLFFRFFEEKSFLFLSEIIYT